MLTITSNDGVAYTREQYEAARLKVIRRLWDLGFREIMVDAWPLTGAIGGYVDGIRTEFYMRDLVRGIVRPSSDKEAFAEYQAAVEKAGVV